MFEQIGDVTAKIFDGMTVIDVSRKTSLVVVPKPANPRFKDLTGERFGRLTVGEYAGKLGNHGAFWCICDCGNVVAVRGSSLLRGNTNSCGCYGKKKSYEANLTHGLSNTDEYKILRGMINRCYNKNVPAYPRYGGRGITVCDRWRFGEDGKAGIECFLEDMGRKPTKKHTVDRFPDPNGNYEPNNARWATMKEQNFNKSTTRFLDFDGRHLTVPEWSDITGIPSQTIYRRISEGWPVAKLLTQKLR